ncbi:fimbria/pilus outer membrane usher protein [Chromobacterium alkanivorans]|uniref:fimbria/pilus outer membrane usher protein n=1 Tax=Chromobacterium alkanivorans TaxID=1071719 RepID=UPI001967E207|nr:fimbria/pilus outer membrane usher protein [Chromobacterium alkanivorans]MBN3006706.1 fimbria/pilus outer membrane usher protein [Chromobacterium alkanivorans]
MKCSIEWLLRPIPLLLWLVGLVPVFSVEAAARGVPEDGTMFDLGVLKASGIDPGVAEYFSQGARFVPGRNRVSLSVNGAGRGSTELTIDGNGRLCVDDGFWAAAGLLPTADRQPAEAGCRELTDFYPQAVVKLRPELARVDILAPSSALRREQAQLDGYDSGGGAGLFNYELLAMRSSSGGRSLQYLQGFTELGFNWNDWMVRSRQSFARNEASNRFQYLYSYAQKTLLDSKSILQLGELSLNNPLFAGVNFSGAQWLPQGALLPRGNLPLVKGIAQSEARVEVRQSGALVYSTMVPPGAFELNDVPILSAGFDLHVTVTESDGSQHAFTVPAAAFFASPAGDDEGFNIAAGRVRQFGGQDGDTPWLFSGSRSWRLARELDLSLGGLWSERFHSAGGALSYLLSPQVLAGARAVTSRDNAANRSGMQYSASLSAAWGERLSGALSVSRQSAHFRTLSDSAARQQETPTALTQYGLSLSYRHDALGAFSLGVTRSRNGADATQRLNGGWSRRLGGANVTLNMGRDLGQSAGAHRNQFYLNVDLPLERASLSAYLQRYGQSETLGTSYREIVSDNLNYSVAAERDANRNSTGFNGNLHWIPRYAQLGLGLSQRSGAQSYNASLRGGALWHERGLTFSPYPLRDSIGVVSVGGLSGVKFSTPSGPVWSDGEGHAVLASLNAYADTRVELQTPSLPRNADVANGLKVVRAGHGSVSQVAFSVLKTQRLLIQIVGEGGTSLAAGLSVVDAEGRFVTITGSGGEVFLDQAMAQNGLYVEHLPGQRCRLSYVLPDEEASALYQTVKASCVQEPPSAQLKAEASERRDEDRGAEG